MKRGLAFSGGKDSWACLLLEPDISNVTVIWVNTGKNYPELLMTVEKARAMCPNFVEVKTDREAQNLREGIPADVVPINWTRLGQQMAGEKPIAVQSYLGCCYENISGPLHSTAKALGITHLVRGQRLEEGHKSPARDGMVVDGITYIQPIEGWTKSQVMAFLDERMEIPDHFALQHSSMDCYDCTAYAKESKDRVEWMRVKHPDLYRRYFNRAKALQSAISEATS